MRGWIFLPGIFIAAILQATLLDSFKLFNVKPDLLLIAVVITALYFNFNLKWALGLAIFAGILKDVFSLNPFGLNLFLFPLWSLLIIKLSRQITLESNFVRIPLLFIIVVLNDMIIKLICFSGGQFIPAGIYLRTLFFESLYTAAILPFAFKVLWKG